MNNKGTLKPDSGNGNVNYFDQSEIDMRLKDREEIGNIRSEVAEVRGEMGGLAREVGNLTKTVKELANLFQNSRATNWTNVIGFLSVVLILIGGLFLYNKQQMQYEATVRNVLEAHQLRMNAILWNASPLGAITKYPDEPYSLPVPP